MIWPAGCKHFQEVRSQLSQCKEAASSSSTHSPHQSSPAARTFSPDCSLISSFRSPLFHTNMEGKQHHCCPSSACKSAMVEYSKGVLEMLSPGERVSQVEGGGPHHSPAPKPLSHPRIRPRFGAWFLPVPRASAVRPLPDCQT